MRKIGNTFSALAYAAALVLGIVVGIGVDQTLDTNPLRTASVTAEKVAVTANLDLN